MRPRTWCNSWPPCCLEQRPPSPRQFRPEAPKGLAKVVLRCLENSQANGSRATPTWPSVGALWFDGPDPGHPGSALHGGSGGYDARGRAGGCDQPVGVWITDGFYGPGRAAPPKMLACVLGWICVMSSTMGCSRACGAPRRARPSAGCASSGRTGTRPGSRGLASARWSLSCRRSCRDWAAFAANPRAYLSTPQLTQTLIGLSCYVVMALLFITARRRNGFAAVQDLLTGTRWFPRPRLARGPCRR